MQSSLVPCYLIRLRIKYEYIPQLYILRYPQLKFLPHCDGPTSTPIQTKEELMKIKKNYSCFYEVLSYVESLATKLNQSLTKELNTSDGLKHNS